MPRNKRNPTYRNFKPRDLGFVELFVAEKRRPQRFYFPGPFNSAQSKAAYHRVLADLQFTEFGEVPNCLKKPEERVGISVSRLVDLYIEKEAKVRYRTKDGSLSGGFPIVNITLQYWVTHFGDLRVEEFTPRLLKSLRDRLIKKRLARSTINDKMRIIVTALRWAVEEELVHESAWRSLQAVRTLQRGRSEAKETEPITPVEKADVEAVLPHLTSVLRAMVLVQWFSGARPGEVCTMRIREVDRSGKNWIYKPEHHKTLHHGKKRLLVLGPKAREELSLLLRPDPDAYFFSPEVSERERKEQRHADRKTPLSCGNKPGSVRTPNPKRPPGAFFSTQSYGRAVKRACVNAGIAPWTPNQLRHSAATRIRKEFSLEHARAVLGHSSTSTTEIYAEVDKTIAIDVMERIG
ncbi:MAG: tyrosine-type recombinase/integrase [Planctomycetota bacterium]